MIWLALALSVTPDAHASAYYFLDAGTRGMARGGAFVASADDLSAMYYNPAALMNLDGPQAMFNFSLVDQKVNFIREDNFLEDDEGPWPVSENIGPPMTVPGFGVAHNFGLDNWMFAVGLYPPAAPDMEYPADGAQRYTLVDALLWQLYAGPDVAWRPLPWLTIGGGVAWTLVRAEQSLDINLCVDDITDDLENRCPTEYYSQQHEGHENDVNIAMKMVDPMNITWTAGLLIQPVDWLTIGASYLPPVKVKGTGTLGAEFSPDHWLAEDGYGVLDGNSFMDDDITVTLTMPAIARLGVAVRPLEPLEVELAGVYQGWHATSEVLISDVNLELDTKEDGMLQGEPILINDDVLLPANYVDSYSLRLGGQWDFDKPVSLRMGTFYESSAVPLTTQGVTIVDGQKWGWSAGGSYVVKKRVSIDAAILQSWIKQRTITDSEIYSLEVPINLAEVLGGSDMPTLDIVDGPAVGNGSFKSSLLIVSLGATVYFGQR